MDNHLILNSSDPNKSQLWIPPILLSTAKRATTVLTPLYSIRWPIERLCLQEYRLGAGADSESVLPTTPQSYTRLEVRVPLRSEVSTPPRTLWGCGRRASFRAIVTERLRFVETITM